MCRLLYSFTTDKDGQMLVDMQYALSVFWDDLFSHRNVFTKYKWWKKLDWILSRYEVEMLDIKVGEVAKTLVGIISFGHFEIQTSIIGP